jgi:quercetin dioxygenase-like cupin family protein
MRSAMTVVVIRCTLTATVAGLMLTSSCRDDDDVPFMPTRTAPRVAPHLDDNMQPEPSARTSPARRRSDPELEPAPRPEVDVSQATLINLDEVKWAPGPPSLRKGAQLAVLEGTPPFPADTTFTVLVKLPRNFTIAPHTHLVTERVTVLKGMLSFGHGARLDRASATRVKAGGLVLIPADHDHYAFTTNEETVIALNGVGPWEIVYVDPKDDPRPVAATKPATKVMSQWDVDTDARIVQASDVAFTEPQPGMLPRGAKIAVLEGDPKLTKVFTVRLLLPTKGFKIPVHAHSYSERFMVLAGASRFAMGDEFDLAKTKRMTVGGVGIVPGNARHYVQSDATGTVVQISGVGPLDMKWADMETAPKP